jgi:poly-beta-hydroxybutyrate-responsive repressor
MARDDENQTESGSSARDEAPGGMPKNWLTAVLLLLLREWSSYGYDLMEKASAFGFAALNPGTLYRVLRQMEKEGLVSSGWDTSGQGPARRIYSITEAGEAYLKLWAGSLEQYRRVMDSFFRLYIGRPMSKRRDPEKDEK